eukprot:gene25774-11439_t
MKISGPRGLGGGSLKAQPNQSTFLRMHTVRPFAPSTFLHQNTSGSMRLKNVILREAASTDRVVTKPDVIGGDGDSALGGASLNGKASMNGSNGNGSGHVNGSNGAHATASATTNGNGNGSAKAFTNVNNSISTPATATASTSYDSDSEIDPESTFERRTNPEYAGQIETVAATAQNEAIAKQARIARENADKRASRSSAGSPYKAPSNRWNQIKGYSTFRRTTEIWFFAFQFAFKYFMTSKKFTYGKAGMTKEAVSARKKELAIWLREGLVRLGPTFIKIGQQFSTRVDVLSPEFIEELEKLQDKVPSFDSETAYQILEAGLGKKVSEVFDSFEDVPLAAASLGQVHRAVIKGQEVVVKIQRPGLKALFDIDCKNIRALAEWLQKTDPKNDGAQRDWVAIYDECSRILYQEIDYTLEGRNADRFRENFKDVSWVKVPNVLWEYSSAEVLVLEYVPGVKINNGEAIDKMGLSRQKLARYAVESYLLQILRHGFFHADPHPGNVAVDATNGGRLIYYDFGMVGSIPPTVKEGIVGLFYSVYNKDPDRCLQALTDMGVYVPTGDRTAVRRTAEFFLESFTERLEAQKKERAEKGSKYSKSFKGARSKEDSKEVRKKILANIGEDLLVASADQPFRFPATFTFVARSFSVLDGIGKSLDARFDISEISAPYARELLLEGQGNAQLAKIQKDLGKRANNQNRAVANLFRSPNRIEDVAVVLQKMERGDLKLRVRALEAERALSRVSIMQRVIASALAASTLVNMGTILWASALGGPSTACFVGATFFALMTAKNFFKVAQKRLLEFLNSGISITAAHQLSATKPLRSPHTPRAPRARMIDVYPSHPLAPYGGATMDVPISPDHIEVLAGVTASPASNTSDGRFKLDLSHVNYSKDFSEESNTSCGNESNCPDPSGKPPHFQHEPKPQHQLLQQKDYGGGGHPGWSQPGYQTGFPSTPPPTTEDRHGNGNMQICLDDDAINRILTSEDRHNNDDKVLLRLDDNANNRILTSEDRYDDDGKVLLRLDDNANNRILTSEDRHKDNNMHLRLDDDAINQILTSASNMNKFDEGPADALCWASSIPQAQSSNPLPRLLLPFPRGRPAAVLLSGPTSGCLECAPPFFFFLPRASFSSPPPPARSPHRFRARRHAERGCSRQSAGAPVYRSVSSNSEQPKAHPGMFLPVHKSPDFAAFSAAPPAASCLLQSPSRPLGSQLGGPAAKKAVVMSQSGNPYAAPKHWADLGGPAPLNHGESGAHADGGVEDKGKRRTPQSIGSTR